MLQQLRTKTPDKNLSELFVELANDCKKWIVAELAVVKAQVEGSIRKLLTAIILIVLAAVIALAGIVVLSLSLVLVLTPYFGAVAAGFTVGGLLIILAILFALYARSTIDISGFIPNRMRNALSSEKVNKP